MKARRWRRWRDEGKALPPLPEECYPPLSVVLDESPTDARSSDDG